MIGHIDHARAAADDAAAEWLLLHDRLMSDSETARFEAWLGASPENAEAWDHARAVWASFDDAPDPLLVSIQQSARAMRPAWRVLPVQGVAMAASILLCLGVFAWNSGVLPGRDDHPAVPVAALSQRYDAGPKRREVTLADGTRVTLDARASISVRQTAGRRDVALLDGQAFFRVVHDASRPFVVSANGRTVTATGTAFAVAVISSRLSVVLEEGSVTVASESGAALARLRPGQAFEATEAQNGEVTDVDVGEALAWRSGYVELHNVSIGEAVARMNRYTATPVTVGDGAAGALRVTGQFRTDDPIRFVETLSELYPVRIKRNQSGSVSIVSVKTRKER